MQSQLVLCNFQSSRLKQFPAALHGARAQLRAERHKIHSLTHPAVSYHVLAALSVTELCMLTSTNV